MKRLAFDARTIGDHYPGIGRYAFGVWQALGDQVAYSITDPNLRNTRFKIGGLTRESFGVRSPLAQLAVPLKLRDADIYYSPYFLMPYLLPCSSVVTLYDATPLYERKRVSSKIVFRLTNYLAGRVAHRVIVLSESAKEEMVTLGIPRQKMIVCPPGLDPKFHPRTKDEVNRVKSKYSLPDEFLLNFGSKKWHKNTKALVEIGDWRLVIVGNATHEVSSRHFVCDRVEENDLPALYSSASALIFPSLREGFGLPIIEAMACGTPVVCLPAPGVKEAAGDAAVMADDMTNGALAQAASRLRDPIFREEKRIAGLEWVKRFTWEKTVQVICNL
ncbi:MAG: glycosyltransferase family 4 protein [Chloroflexi bacterium]|nr:glycosyltransferase family 4 protein [Chloroflexota bacterium]